MAMVRPDWRVEAPPVVILELATLEAPPETASAAIAMFTSAVPAKKMDANAAAVRETVPIAVKFVLDAKRKHSN